MKYSSSLLFLFLIISGCAFNNEYVSTYQEAVKEGSNLVITKEESYQDLNQKIPAFFKAHGYANVIYSDDKKKFYVFSKIGLFDEPCQIILKYTANPDNKIRIDLVKGSDSVITDSQVQDDINQIVEKIKSI